MIKSVKAMKAMKAMTAMKREKMTKSVSAMKAMKAMKATKAMQAMKAMSAMKAKKMRCKFWSGWIQKNKQKWEYLAHLSIDLRYTGQWPHIVRSEGRMAHNYASSQVGKVSFSFSDLHRVPVATQHVSEANQLSTRTLHHTCR